MKAAEIRQSFIDFFTARAHQHVPSSSLVPDNDPTLLFTNSGMVQFKDVFLGLKRHPYDRAVTAQRCMRAGGKHNDLDNVGYTARHHTFFEMLGNFSFGAYFKEQAIDQAWEFVTRHLGLDPERLLVTVHHSDEDAANIWRDRVGVPAERVLYLGESNFWQMGNTGPCGPCSEIFYDHGPGVAGGPPGSAEEDGDRFIEIWNLVFMQFERGEDGSMVPLPRPSVDTGMGLERIAAVLQGVQSNYQTDLFAGLLDALQGLTGKDERHLAGHHVIVDHIRASAFMVADAISPNNAGRGYVLRRIIRRALRHGYKLGLREAFLSQLLDPLLAEMGASNPQLLAQRAHISATIVAEERQFLSTLSQGMNLLEKELERSGDCLAGDVAFRLYDSCGFPLDLTQDVCRERSVGVDVKGFEIAMRAQRERARAAANFQAQSFKIPADVSSDFVGYNHLSRPGKLAAIFADNQAVTELAAPAAGALVLTECPFYPQSGGQLGDSGMVYADGAEFEVEDCQRQGEALVLLGRMLSGVLKVRAQVSAQVDANRRQQIAAHHSATHLLHAALRAELGEHVEQRGSLVSADKLRFDFTHPNPLDSGQLERVARLVNEQIRANTQVNVRTMPKAEALKAGATALFGEKYADQVRVVQMGEKVEGKAFSLELCGGTHASRTGDLGYFYLVNETPVAAGIRRVEALTAVAAQRQQLQQQAQLQQLTQLVKIGDWQQLPERIGKLQQELKSLQQQKANWEAQRLQLQAAKLREQFQELGAAALLVQRVDGLATDAARQLADQLKAGRQRSLLALFGERDGRYYILIGCSAELARERGCQELLQSVNARYGGRGGGRADLATGSLERLPPLVELQQLCSQYLS